MIFCHLFFPFTYLDYFDCLFVLYDAYGGQKLLAKTVFGAFFCIFKEKYGNILIIRTSYYAKDSKYKL